jgi:hypothetical protein
MHLIRAVFSLLVIAAAGPAAAQVAPIRAVALPRVVAGTVAAPAAGSGPRIPAPLSSTRRMQLTGGTDGSVFASLGIASPLLPGRAYLELLQPIEVRTWTYGSDQPRALFEGNPQSGLRLMASPPAPSTFLVDCRIAMQPNALMQVTPAVSTSVSGAVQNYSPAQLVDGHLVFLLQTTAAGWAQVNITSTGVWNLFGCELRTI